MSERNQDVLPAQWARATVGDLAEYINGLAFKPTDWEQTGRPIIRIQNLTDPEAPFNRTCREVETRYIVTAGDILVSWSATLDAFRWTGIEAVLNQHIFRVVPNPRCIDRELLYWGLKVVLREMWEGEHTHGSTMRHINRGPFLAHPFALPPLNEQPRIVSKIKSLVGRAEQAKSALDAVPALLGHFRQSILAAAFRGDLTADWRVRNPDVEPADQLLEKIRAERRRRWEAAELAKLTAKGKPPTDDRWKAGYPVPWSVDVDTSDGLSELPTNWCWASLDEIIAWGPQNGLYVPATQYGSGSEIIRIDDYQDSFLRERTNLRRVQVEEKIAGLYGLEAGDILVNRVNAPSHLGKAAIVPASHSGTLFESNMMRMRVSALANPEFTHFYLCSREGRAALTRDAKWAVNQASINQGDVLKTMVPLAPLEESEEVVVRITSALSQREAVQAVTSRLQTLVDSLDQAILAKAFRGELVPQDPNDEPASVLLERLRAEAAATPAKPSRRSRTPASSETPAASTTASISQSDPTPLQALSPGPDEPPPLPSPSTPTSALRMTQPQLPGIAVDCFLELPAEAQAAQVHAILLGEGPFPREDAVRRAAELLRAAGRASFQRLRQDGPLATCIDAAIAIGLRHSNFDRPAPGSVRALARLPEQVPLALWRRALLAALVEPETDADAAVRDAAAWSQAQFGLEFQRLRAGGRIDTALRAALAEMLATRAIVSDRHGILSPGTRPG